jgi:predicted nucleic acid-binding protein
MVRAIIDTNILVDFLRGLPQAEQELALYEYPAISIVSWIEVLAGTTPQTERAAKAFLRSFDLYEIGEQIAERAVHIRKSTRIKLPDAVIWATAQVHQCLLVTRNTRDFDAKDPGVRTPYML